MDFLEGILNGLIEICGNAVNGVLSLLPMSPFSNLSLSVGADIVAYINFFVPVGQMITISSAWLSCIAIWYVVQICLRWLKAAE